MEQSDVAAPQVSSQPACPPAVARVIFLMDGEDYAFRKVSVFVLTGRCTVEIYMLIVFAEVLQTHTSWLATWCTSVSNLAFVMPCLCESVSQPGPYVLARSSVAILRVGGGPARWGERTVDWLQYRKDSQPIEEMFFSVSVLLSQNKFLERSDS